MNHKRIIYNEILMNNAQIEHITDFLELALRHKQKIPRKFRIIISDQTIIPIDQEALGSSQ